MSSGLKNVNGFGKRDKKKLVLTFHKKTSFGMRFIKSINFSQEKGRILICKPDL